MPPTSAASIRGRSASNPTRSKFCPPPNVGLVNRIDAGWIAAASAAFVMEAGHVFWQETPSKSVSVAMQPPTWTRSESSGLKQDESSPSFLLLSPSAGLTHLPWTLAWPQYSKWPISSAKATLYEWAAHGTRVCSLDVAYMGWKAYGVCVHAAAFGAKLTWAKPLATLAVIDPVSPLVTS